MGMAQVVDYRPQAQRKKSSGAGGSAPAVATSALSASGGRRRLGEPGRRLRLNTWYSQTAWLMISAGKRWR